MKFISLGSSCSIAYNLKILNKRDESLPFDWIRSSKFSSINQMLSNNFVEFFNPDNYQLLRSSDRFFLQQDNLENKNINMDIYKNTFYQINFYHEFPTEIEFNNSFINFKEKYKRRVNRLLDFICKHDNTEIIFIRDQLKINHINIQDIVNFISIIKNLNPKLKFKLVIILNNYKNKDISNLISNNFENVVIINDNKSITSWEREDIIKPILEKFIQ